MYYRLSYSYAYLTYEDLCEANADSTTLVIKAIDEMAIEVPEPMYVSIKNYNTSLLLYSSTFNQHKRSIIIHQSSKNIN